MAITQLQDVSNEVAQDAVSSNARLRNEEIRRRMYDDWEEPTSKTTGSTPTTIENTATNYEGNDATLASTYSKLLNNWNTIGGSSLYSQPESTSTASTTPSSLNLPSWAPTAVGAGMTLGGLGQYASLGSAATSLLQGNRAGAAGTLSSMFTNKLTEGQVPGLGGAVGTLVSGLIGDRSKEEIGRGLVNSGIGTAIGMTNPIAGLSYSLARSLGFNPAYGLNNLFGNGLQGVPAGFEGTLGGFFGENALGSGVTSGGGSSTPGYGSGDLGSGITTGGTGTGLGYSSGTLGGGISGGLSGSYGGYSSSGGDDSGDSD